MNKLAILMTILIGSMTTINAQSLVSLKQRLKTRNQIQNLNIKLSPYLYDQDVRDRLRVWTHNLENNAYIVSCFNSLKGYIKSEKVLSIMCYANRALDGEDKNSLIKDLSTRYLLELRTVFFDIATDPRFLEDEDSTGEEVPSSFVILKKLTDKNIENFSNCMTKAKFIWNDENEISSTEEVNNCLAINNIGTNFYNINVQKIVPNHPGHPLSEIGWINNNKVDYLTYNDTSEDMLKEISKRDQLIKIVYTDKNKGDLESMLSADLSEVFSVKEGFSTFQTNPVWNQKGQDAKNTFKHMKEAIDNAQESIFIDIFFLGGDLGQAIAKELVKKAKEGKKVFILRDIVNHFGLQDHMTPVTNYLLAAMLKQEKKNLLVVPSYIEDHKSGLPRFVSRLNTPEIVKAIGLDENLPLDPGAISDHSKVMVVDGMSKTPIAFVGSKNWLDQSGAFCWDEVVKIQGPGAKVVLDDYYLDMFYGLKHSEQLPQIKAKWGLDKETDNKAISRILAPFDLLGRDENHNIVLKTHHLETIKMGGVSLKTGLNNFNSSTTNILDQVVNVIDTAKREIKIKDQYLFDRHVVTSLINAKKKLKEKLSIQVIIGDFFPNYLYADLLTAENIEVKFKKFIKHDRVAQEFHMKTISVDGHTLISGSANKDQTTMFGSFREEQIQIFDKIATAVHDDTFQAMWDDSSEVTEKFEAYNEKTPKELEGIQQKLSEKGVSVSANDLMRTIRRALALFYDALGL